MTKAYSSLSDTLLSTSSSRASVSHPNPLPIKGNIHCDLLLLSLIFFTETTLPGTLSSMSPTSTSGTSVSPSPITDGNHANKRGLYLYS